MSNGLILLLLVIFLLLVRAPLFLLIGSLTISGYALYEGIALDQILIAESVRQITDKPPLLAIPFFVLSGGIMSRGAIAQRLVNVAKAVFSGIPGGLGIAAVIACMFFAAISGSSPVTVITIGGVMYPALLKAKYPESFSAGLLTSAGTLGIIIPPSIPMIVYAIFASGAQVIQVEDLFLAGIGPGFLIGGFLAVYCLFTGLMRGEKFRRSELNFKDTLIDGFWSLMLPVIILGGIYSGIFTATEAAAVSVVYSLIVEIYIHRSLTIKDLVPVIGESTVLMGSLLIILTMAVGLNDLLAELELPEKAVAWIKTHELTPTSFMLYLNAFLLVVGCFMDIMSAIMILVPLLAPMAMSYGIDPIHLGIVFIVNLELGYLTPPMGLNLFVASSLFKKSMGEMIKSVVPFLLILFVALMTITYIPTIALGPVNYLKGQPVYVPFPSAKVSNDLKQSGDGKSIEGKQGGDEKANDGKANDGKANDGKDQTKPKAKSLQDLMKEQGIDTEDEEE